MGKRNRLDNEIMFARARLQMARNSDKALALKNDEVLDLAGQVIELLEREKSEKDAEVTRLTNLIGEHNAKLESKCVQALRRNGKVKEPRWNTQCDRTIGRRDICPDCPLDYTIDIGGE